MTIQEYLHYPCSYTIVALTFWVLMLSHQVWKLKQQVRELWKLKSKDIHYIVEVEQRVASLEAKTTKPKKSHPKGEK